MQHRMIPWHIVLEVGRPIGLAAVYFMTAKLSLLVAIPPGYATAIWPPSGIALAAILLLGARIWPGIWLGAALTNLTIQGSPLLAILIGTGNTLEAVMAGELVRRYVGYRGNFCSGEAVVKFVALSVPCALVAATIGVLSLTLSGVLPWASFIPNAWTWAQGDASGMIIFTPLIMSWVAKGWPRGNASRWVEATALASSLVIGTIFIFSAVAADGTPLPLAFVPLPFILWAAIRFEQREVTTAIAIVCAIAVWYTLKGKGEFALGSANPSLLFLLAYTSTLVLTGLVLSAVIGQRKRADMAIRQRVDQLQAGERQINEFLAMLSHELRNPLAPIVNALALMRNDPDREPKEPRRIIERQVSHLSRIVDDLLDISRITRGKILLKREVQDLNDIVLLALESSQPLIDERQHTMESRLCEERLPIDADSTRITQVILNLITNAVKFTPKAGRISIGLTGENDHAVIRVRDTGIGIAQEFLPKVFDLFTQGDRSLDRSEGGLGIGLTVAKRIVEMHGGSIEAFSDGPGRGSEFVVHLPLAPDRAARTPATEPVASPPPGRLRLLVVDDNHDSADTLTELLKIMGHEVRTAYEGQTAIAVAATFLPDTVLLDIGLPGMNGYEVARELRKSQQQTRMRLVAVSGYGQNDDRRRGQEAGFDYYLVKPVDPFELCRIIGVPAGNPAK